MNKKAKNAFVLRDLVFAKVKGYPPWPAMVTKPQQKQKYGVTFYGTRETANVKQEDISPYLEFKEKFATDKNMKRNNFKEAMEEIESERNGVKIMPDSTTVDSDDTNDVTLDESAIQNANDTADEALVDADVSVDALEPPKEIAVTSRSGRKIKKKQFIDDNGDAPPQAPVVTASMKRKANSEQNAPKMPKVEKVDKAVLDAERKRFLIVEKKLCKLSGEIMGACGTHNVDLDKVIQLMEEMRGMVLLKDLRSTAFLLIKHQVIVETIHKLRQYRGNLSAWPMMTDYEKNIFDVKAEEIRKLAVCLVGNFKFILRIPESITFYGTYMQMREDFKNRTKHLTKAEVFDLIDDLGVFDEQMFMDNILQEEESQETV